MINLQIKSRRFPDNKPKRELVLRDGKKTGNRGFRSKNSKAAPRRENTRGIWYMDQRLDFFRVTDERIRRNCSSVAAVCMRNDLLETGNGYRELRVTNYGKMFNLCPRENFYEQLVAAGQMCSAVLVGSDVAATAAHFADKRNVSDLRFFFGYTMVKPGKAAIKIPHEKIYRGAQILQWKCDTGGANSSGSDWALVKLDRKVIGQEIAILSEQNLFYEQPVYAIGYPCGLPLKVAPGIVVRNDRKAYFMAEMDVYNNNSGSPVFDAKTHEMLGIVSRTDCRDFQWSADGVVSIIYPNSEIDSRGIQCTKVSEFIKYCDLLNGY